MKHFTTLIATLVTSAAFAQAGPPATEAEVRKVDKDAGKITLKHGEIKNLDMPAMSMVFQVKDKTLLDKVKPGDKVSFTADKIDGAYTVLSIEPAR
ncbi:copper-binding protein [Polaromonas sp. A23]|uniref:copper-binding protein n=1 Tax=Polaromonas sp. A23 TaxID=1944133 RepID=UPI0009867559|nr:copper-binding protein [Polaromonas sp. A23]OOG46391.1 RND transporter [Polaromonas sp. A23]